MTSSICYDIMQLSNRGELLRRLALPDKGGDFMRFDLIEFLSLLVKEGYMISFRVTKSKIFVAIKNDRQ